MGRSSQFRMSGRSSQGFLRSFHWSVIDSLIRGETPPNPILPISSSSLTEVNVTDTTEISSSETSSIVVTFTRDDTTLITKPVNESDDFIRASGPLGSNWSVVAGNAEIVASRMELTGPTWVTWNNTANSLDSFAEISLGINTPSDNVYVVTRWDGNTGATCYAAYYIVGTGTYLVKIVNGSVTSLGGPYGASTLDEYDLIKVEAIGEEISLYINGSLQAGVTDSSVSDGYQFGIYAEGDPDPFEIVGFSAGPINATPDVGYWVRTGLNLSSSDSTAITSTETSYVGPDEDSEDFEGGTNNAAVDDTNTNFELVSGTGSYTFDSVNALHGGLAGEIDANAGSIRGKFRTLGGRKTLYYSGYFLFEGFTENSKFIEFETLPVSDNGVLNLWLKTTGKIELRDGLDATGTLTSTTLSVDTWYRIDVRYDLDLEEIELRIYSGADLESTGAAYDESLIIAKAEMTNTHVERIMTGRALTNTSLMYVDSLAYSDQDWPAPRGEAATPKTGTDSTEISSSESSSLVISTAVTSSDSTEISSSETSDVDIQEPTAISSSDSTELFLNESTSLTTGAEPGPFEEEETFEGGTVTATVTTGTIFDQTLTGGSSTEAVEDNDPLHGTKHAEFNAVSAASTGRINFPSLQSIVYVRAYMKFSSFSSGTNTSVITFYDTNSTTTVRASAQIMASTPSNGIRIRNGTSTIDTSTTSFSDNTWYRLEYVINNTAGTQELRIWGGATLESADTGDCIEILSGTYNTGTTGRVSFGPIASPGETILTTVDTVAWGNTDWIGPYATGDGTIQVGVSDSTLITGTDSSSLSISESSIGVFGIPIGV